MVQGQLKVCNLRLSYLVLSGQALRVCINWFYQLHDVLDSSTALSQPTIRQALVEQPSPSTGSAGRPTVAITLVDAVRPSASRKSFPAASVPNPCQTV